ncbi:carbohydrate-binding domain-containing protein [Actinoplanes sp. NPDC051851]|uniref:carbohydrate-binding domain-containing protein n=1 Tax=Actinoplanes sp. NPDC051851 TaxID=3154753 RepID=UPI00341ECE21
MRSTKPAAAGLAVTLVTAAAAAMAAGPVTTAAASDQAVARTPGTAAADARAHNRPDHESRRPDERGRPAERRIRLTGHTARVSGPGVAVAGATVTIGAPGTYRISGTLTDGQLIVDSPGSGLVRLILAGVSISSSTSAPLVVADAGQAEVILADGTENTLSDAAVYTYPDGEDEPNAALFSTTDLTIGGSGSLTVTGNAEDGITSKDGLVVDGGTITVTAADDGVRGKDYLVVNGGTLTVTATGGDAFKSDNDEDATAGYIAVSGGTLTATAAGDDGLTAETDVLVDGGTVTLGGVTGKGIKAGKSVVVSDGTVTVDAVDDGVHSDDAITVDGGGLTVSSGDDGVHAEGVVDISAGNVAVLRSYEGIEGLKVLISGGEVRATSQSDDAVNASEEGVGEFEPAPNALIEVSGGTVIVDGGTDGLDSNGALTISGGVVVALGSSRIGGGEGALDSNGDLLFTGGTLVAAAISAVTSPTPTTGQGWTLYGFAANQPVGTVVHLVAEDGTPLLTYVAAKEFKGVLFTSPEITTGSHYSIYTGGAANGTPIADGFSTGGDLTGATMVVELASGTAAGDVQGFPGGGGGGFPSGGPRPSGPRPSGSFPTGFPSASDPAVPSESVTPSPSDSAVPSESVTPSPSESVEPSASDGS